MTTESKRRRTPPTPAPKPPPRRRRRGIADFFSFGADDSSRLLLFAGVALVLILAGGFIAYGYYATVIKPRHRTVLGAEGVSISYEAMRRHMAYDLAQNPTYLQSQQIFASLPQTAYQELLDEIIIWKLGPKEQNVSVGNNQLTGNSDLETVLRARVGVPSNANQQQFAAAFRAALDKAKITETEYRRMVLADELKTKIQAKITQELPATAPQAKVEVIQTATKDNADKALARVKAGEDWVAVSKDLSTASDKDTGGATDYQLEGEMNSAYSGFAFSAANGQVSDVITSGATDSQTFYVVRVVDRADKPLTDTQKPAEAQRRYAKWLADAEGHTVVTNHWDQQAQSDALLWVLNHVPPPTPVPTQAQAQPTAAAPAAGTPAAQGTPAANGNNPVAPNAPVAPGSGNGQ